MNDQVLSPDRATVDILGMLVSFDTTSYRSNLDLIDYVYEYLSGQGVDSRLDFNNPNTQTLLTLLATLTEGAVLSMMLNAYHPANAFSVSFTTLVVPEAVYNAILIPLAVPLISWAKKHFSGWHHGSLREAR